jgi:hypothetical protein
MEINVSGIECLQMRQDDCKGRTRAAGSASVSLLYAVAPLAETTLRTVAVFSHPVNFLSELSSTPLSRDHFDIGILQELRCSFSITFSFTDIEIWGS